MRSSNITAGLAVLGCWVAAGGLLHGDELILNGGAQLTGTVRSITEAGVLELASELSPDPIWLKSAALEKVLFSSSDAPPKPPPALIELINGDRLPASLESFDDRVLVVSSPEAGRLEIPRNALKSLQLGIRQRNLIYAGPRDLEEWSGEGDVKNWIFEGGQLVANGPATASKNFALPAQFILRFTLHWQPKQIPNFQVYFADPLKAKGELCDRYYLQFGGAGLEIKREAAKGQRWSTIVVLNRSPNLYPGQQLQVELRVDRKGSRLQLLLNGEPEGQFIDHIPSIPDGSGITLVCNSQSSSPQRIGDIEILELDDAPDRHHAEERGDTKTDSLISSEDDRWSGHLMEILPGAAAEQVFRFKSAFQEGGVLEIPAGDVSTVFFATKDAGKPAAQPAAAPNPLVLRLRGQGSLRVASCVFTGDTVVADHPLLGRLNLRRDGIGAIERIAVAQPPAAPQP